MRADNRPQERIDRYKNLIERRPRSFLGTRVMDNEFTGFALSKGVEIIYTPETGSTNDLAREMGLLEGYLVVADSQTKGRGQRGNSWHSEAGKNLTFSVVFEPFFLAPDIQFLLSECVSLAVTDMLASYSIPAVVKWPNDIYVDDKKIAGILIENDICGGKLSRSIAGIGLNVNQQDFPEGIPNPVSMRLAFGKEFIRAEVLGRLCDALLSWYGLLRSGQYEAISRVYHERLYLLNKPHIFHKPLGIGFEGVIRQVKPTGEMIVATPEGDKGFFFKEIMF